MRIGIYAGTFDPVHRGHIAFAKAALKKASLDKVVFLPERSPRGKLGVSDFKHRLGMLRLAVRPHRKLSVLAIDDPQFTVQHTLGVLQERFAGAKLVLLMGSDVVRTFGFRWPGLDTLLASVELAVGMRTGESEGNLQEFLESLQIPFAATFIDGPHAHVSATGVRDGDMQSIEPIVRTYIEENQLYQPTAA